MAAYSTADMKVGGSLSHTHTYTLSLSIHTLTLSLLAGDVYAGGNPWILSTAALAELLYNGAVETLRTRALPPPRALAQWRRFFSLILSPEKRKEIEGVEFTYVTFARAVSQSGDDVLFRLRSHVESYGFHLSEQLDKVTGLEGNAKDLTWAYACVLKVRVCVYVCLSCLLVWRVC